MSNRRLNVPLAEIKIDSDIHKAVKNTLKSGKYILRENNRREKNEIMCVSK